MPIRAGFAVTSTSALYGAIVLITERSIVILWAAP